MRSCPSAIPNWNADSVSACNAQEPVVSHDHYNAETDFREMIRTPQKLFGYGFFYFLGTIALLGMLYVWNLGAIGKNSIAPLVPRDSSAFVRDIPLKSPSVLPPIDVAVASVPTEESVARGRELFRTSCASCHGDNGLGDGPAGSLLTPKPRNFTSLQGWTNGSKISQIYRTLQEGIVRNGMAAYDYVPPADRFALVHFVRSLAPGQPLDAPEELQLLEATYQLSKGTSTPGQIPVAKATRLVLAEREGRVRAVRETARRAAEEKDNPGALLLKQVTDDPVRVLSAFGGKDGVLPEFGQFVAMVSRSPHSVGFTPSVVGLSRSEWQLVYAYLSELLLRVQTSS